MIALKGGSGACSYPGSTQFTGSMSGEQVLAVVK